MFTRRYEPHLQLQTPDWFQAVHRAIHLHQETVTLITVNGEVCDEYTECVHIVMSQNTLVVRLLPVSHEKEVST